jgi:hypothetical protein
MLFSSAGNSLTLFDTMSYAIETFPGHDRKDKPAKSTWFADTKCRPAFNFHFKTAFKI